MLADAVLSLGYLAFRPLIQRLTKAGVSFHERWRNGDTSLSQLLPPRHQGYTTLRPQDDDVQPASRSPDHHHPGQEQQRSISHHLTEADQDDAPPSQLISNRTVAFGLVLSIAFCALCIHIVFGDLVPLYATLSAVLMALVLSIMGVRALGETDLNPVSGISKLAQLFFALIVPQSHPSSVLINLVAGAVSEAGALQAGDLMQDLKTGHLLGAAPKAQFWGQVIGATVGAIVSAFIYRLYTAVYTIPGSLFQVPTAYVWIFTARLVTGQGLPYMAREWAIAFAMLFTLTTTVRIYATNKRWQHLIPGGIAVAVGMYNGTS
jgi:OPT family oligopeptide transporter